MPERPAVKTPAELRSARWFAPDDFRSFGHRSRAMQMGYAPEDWEGRPVIAILNTWSDAQPCHAHFKHRVEDIKRGILQEGGFPLELPALSLSESFVKPTTMLYRNMLAMETEELLRRRAEWIAPEPKFGRGYGWLFARHVGSRTSWFTREV